jgi:predicted 3-demethylubiquinone-9 3-methyltransferase (glyoxalase superfamily)
VNVNRITPFLMFNDQLEAALDFYTRTFPDAEVIQVSHAGETGPVQAAEFVIGGQRFKAFNGGSHFTFSDGISLYVDCESQEEVDRYWEALVGAGGAPCSAGGSRTRSACPGRSCRGVSSS